MVGFKEARRMAKRRQKMNSTFKKSVTVNSVIC